MVYFKENYDLKVPEGFNIFQGGGALLSGGGGKFLISIETYRTCYFAHPRTMNI